MNWFEEGCRLRDLGTYEEAIACFDKVEPPTGAAWYEKARAAIRLGRAQDAMIFTQAAEGLLEKEIRDAPSDGAKILQRADCLYVLQRFEDALACFTRVVELDSTNLHAWLNRAALADDLGRREEAVEAYQKFLEHARDQLKEACQAVSKRLKELE